MFEEQEQGSKLSSHLGTSEDSSEDISQRLKQLEDFPHPSFSSVQLYQKIRYVLADKFKNNIDKKCLPQVLTSALVQGLQHLFAINNPSLKKLVSSFFNSCEQNLVHQNKVPLPQQKEIQKEQKIQNKESPKVEKKEEEQQKIQVSTQDSIINNPYVKESINDELLQKKQSELSPSTLKKIEEMTYPVNWRDSKYFDTSTYGRIKKIYDNDFRQLCSNNPLQGYNKYKFKFRVVESGTIAIGLVPSVYRNYKLFDSRKLNVFKYVAFQKGYGGSVNRNTIDIYQKKKQLALFNGSIVQLQFDKKDMKVTLKTSHWGPQVIQVPSLKNVQLYVFIEMYQMGTCIEFM